MTFSPQPSQVSIHPSIHTKSSIPASFSVSYTFRYGFSAHASAIGWEERLPTLVPPKTPIRTQTALLIGIEASYSSPPRVVSRLRLAASDSIITDSITPDASISRADAASSDHQQPSFGSASNVSTCLSFRQNGLESAGPFHQSYSMLINAHRASPAWKLPSEPTTACVLLTFEVDSEPMPAGDRGSAMGYHADLTQPRCLPSATMHSLCPTGAVFLDCLLASCPTDR